MGDALMNWEAGRSRWRKKYKNIWLQVSAAELGGSTATETRLAANQWLKEKKAEIDKELVLKTPRLNELEYRLGLENIQSDIKALLTAMRVDPDTCSMLAPKVELLKQKETLIKRALQQDVLPPLDDTLRSPLRISPERIEREAVEEVEKQIKDRLYGHTRSPFDILLLSSVPLEDTHNVVNTVPKTPSVVSSVSCGNGVKSIYDKRIQTVAETVSGLKDSVVARKKKEAGLIESEYERGVASQIVKEHGANVPETLKLVHHIDQYLEAQKRECVRGNIKPGRLKKIASAIGSYKTWSPIINGNVSRIGTKEHIEAYHAFIAQRLPDEIKPRYVNDLFGEFKALINWLVIEEILKDYPRCLQLKSNRYRFAMVRQKPKTVPLDLVRRILEAATDNPRLRLFVLLTLNCGFGASEIGQLQKDEYDPAMDRIAHRRYKTEKSDSVPEVVYKLWTETKVLLDQEIENRKNYPQRSQSDKLLLVNENGMPLWSESIEKSKSDNITTSFKRLIAKQRKTDPDFPSVAYYSFRKTISTLIFNKEEFARLDWLWLGHAPSTMAGQSYSAVDKDRLDRCIDWLHSEIFGIE